MARRAEIAAKCEVFHHPIMNIRRLLLALTCVVALSVAAQPKTYRFANIPWGVTPEDVSKQLQAAGFTALEKENQPGYTVYSFQGKIGDDPILGVTYYTPDNKLAKIAISFTEQPLTVRARYLALKKVLADKYGKPLIVNEYFDSPYDTVTGHEDLAFKVGKGHFVSVFKNEQKPSEAAAVQIVENGKLVMVVYESPEWELEVDRLAKEKNKVF